MVIRVKEPLLRPGETVGGRTASDREESSTILYQLSDSSVQQFYHGLSGIHLQLRPQTLDTSYMKQREPFSASPWFLLQMKSCSLVHNIEILELPWGLGSKASSVVDNAGQTILGSSDYILVLCLSEGASLMEHWDSLLKAQLKHQLRGSPLQGQAPYSWMHRNRSLGCYFTKGRDIRVWKPRGRNSRVPPTLAITHNGSLGSFVLPVPATIASAGLDKVLFKDPTLLPKGPVGFPVTTVTGYFGFLVIAGPEPARRATILVGALP